MNWNQLRLTPRSLPISQFNLNRGETKASQTIIACPHPPQEAVLAGQAIAVPRGAFDVDVLLEKLPSGFHPEVVFISARDMSFIPQGLHKFGCPKVMKLGDTYQWGNGSLSQMIEYCQVLGCDYHWTYQGVQHLHFFKEAGLKNVFWLPGTTMFDPFFPNRNEKKIYDVCFRGSLSDVHIYRRYIVNFLKDSGINLDIAQKPYVESLEDYAKSKIVLNCSGGGDTNRRVFEVLMVGGGLLMTDRLSFQSGLQCLFQEGVHLECYGSPDELLEKVNYYLAHPEEAEAIAVRGHEKLISNYSRDLVEKKFYDFILYRKIDSPFLLEHDRRVNLGSTPTDARSLKKRLKIYELIQAIHHLNLQTKLLFWKCRDKLLLTDLVDLPRLKMTCTINQEDFKDICSCVSQVEVVQGIELLRHDDLLDSSQFPMVMVDNLDDYEDLEQELKLLDRFVRENGLVVLVDERIDARPAVFDKITRKLGWKRVHLIEPVSLQAMAVGYHLAYQKRPKDLTPSSTSERLVFKTEESLKPKQRLKRQLLRKSRSILPKLRQKLVGSHLID